MDEMSFEPALFMLHAAIGVTNNASMDELRSIALDQSAIEIVDSFNGLVDVVRKAELFINSFPCGPSAKPSKSNSYKIITRNGKVTHI